MTSLLSDSIRCVAFDAVGTVIYPTPSVSQVYANIAARHGSKLSAAEIRSRFESAMSVFDDDSAANDFQTSEQRETELWREVVGRVLTDVESADACFDELFDWFGRVEAWAVFPDVARTLAGLREQNLTLAIASNFDSRLHAVCNGLPELADIRIRVVSSEVGYRKPSAEYYNRLARACGCQPAEVLMVGDTPTNDVEGATAIGMPAVLIDRSRDTALPGRISSLKQILD
jgi:putative hydrolase of the HAD superfamily